MTLPSELISEFVKITKDDTPKKSETIVYGTIVKSDNSTYMKIDGSELLTPVTLTTNVVDGERVTGMIKNHSLIVTGNISSPSARTGEVETVSDDLKTVKIELANKISVEELDAQIARIGKLEADSAVIGDLKAENAEITGKLTAAEADINNLKAGNVTITGKLEAVEADIENLSVDNLNAKYANIDFANIGEAAFKKIYADSGLIKDLVVGDGTITGELVGVTIKGDLIEGNTVVAEKLVVKGSDGLYYKLNTDGVSIEKEQTEYNSLNGSVITAKSITATKIDVKDLVAFDATIGGFKITESSIYSGVKESVGNTTRGIYLDKDGQISFGDSNNFLKFFKDTDGKYKLDISASEIKLSATGKTVEESIIDLSVHRGTTPPDNPEEGKMWLDTGVSPSTLRRWIGADVANVRSFDVEKRGKLVSFNESTGFAQGKLNITSVLEPIQSGSGDPSPDNVRPIVGLTQAEVKRYGKNLFSGSSATHLVNGVTIKKDCGSEVTLYGTATVTICIPAFSAYLPAGTYTYSIGDIGNINRFESTINGSGIVWLKSGDTLRITLDEPSKVALDVIISKGADLGTESNPTRIKVQLEVGENATAYEPYHAISLYNTFGQTVYGGELNWQTGLLKVDKSIVIFNGTEAAWVRHDASGLMYINALSNPELPVIGQGSPYGACSHYRRTTANGYLDMEDGEFATGLHQFSSVNAYVMFKDAVNGASVSAWKAYLAAQYAAGTPVQVAYKLASPTTIKLTEHDIAALSGVNNLYGESGEIVVKATVSGWEIVNDTSSTNIAIQNEIIESSIYDGVTPPSTTPSVGKLWLDRSLTPPLLRRWAGTTSDTNDMSNWEVVNDTGTIEEAQALIQAKQAYLESQQKEMGTYIGLDGNIVRVGKPNVTSEFQIDPWGCGVAINRQVFSRFESDRVRFGNMEMRRPAAYGGLMLDSVEDIAGVSM